jgi:hypothetical protein
MAADSSINELKLFDGQTSFGWRITGIAVVKDGKLLLGGDRKTTASIGTRFGPATLSMLIENPKGGRILVGSREFTEEGPIKDTFSLEAGAVPLTITVPAGEKTVVHAVTLKPTAMTDLFDGKTLNGWKVFTGDPKREKTQFTVAEGVLQMKNGPGDIATQKLFADFVLQVECKVNGKHLNSGVFFRAIPGQYQNGYEAQIHNDFTAEPPRKYLVDEFDPMTNKATGKREMLSRAKDFGTGAIYRRLPARSAVAQDGEWFTLTVVARGRHIATWVNGIQQVDWTDNRPPHENPRQGYREAAGAISLQGHDPTTDLHFRQIRIAEIPPLKK